MTVLHEGERIHLVDRKNRQYALTLKAGDVLQLSGEFQSFWLRDEFNAWTLQRSFSVHRKFSSFHHGGGHSQRQGQAVLHSLQCGKPPLGSRASRSTQDD